MILFFKVFQDEHFLEFVSVTLDLDVLHVLRFRQSPTYTHTITTCTVTLKSKGTFLDFMELMLNRRV